MTIQDIKNSYVLKTNASLASVKWEFVIWSTYTFCSILYLLLATPIPTYSSTLIPKEHVAITSLAYQISSSFCAFGGMYAFLSCLTSKIPEKVLFSWILVYICAIDCCSHVLLDFGLSLVSLDFNGYPVLWSRWACWMATAPSIVLLLGELTKSEKEIRPVYDMVHGFLISGFFAAVTHSVLLAAVLSVVSSLFLLRSFLIINHICNNFTKTNGVANSDSVQVCKYLTFGSWIAFPITFFAIATHLISFGAGEMAYSIANVVSKVLVTIVVVHSTVEILVEERVEAVRELSLDLENRLEVVDAILQKFIPRHPILGIAEKKRFENVTLFYSDISNFEAITGNFAKMKNMQEIWKEYEIIGTKFNMISFKTFGDCFLGVFGIDGLDEKGHHASRAVEYSLEVLSMLKSFQQHQQSESMHLEIRFGIASGAVDAVNCSLDAIPNYYIVGESVGLAKLMQDNSKPMRIHISESTYELIKDFSFVVRRDVLPQDVCLGYRITRFFNNFFVPSLNLVYWREESNRLLCEWWAKGNAYAGRSHI